MLFSWCHLFSSCYGLFYYYFYSLSPPCFFFLPPHFPSFSFLFLSSFFVSLGLKKFIIYICSHWNVFLSFKGFHWLFLPSDIIASFPFMPPLPPIGCVWRPGCSRSHLLRMRGRHDVIMDIILVQTGYR
ncbi:hypothetical protein FKM82_028108 [Ascaphus truei]